MANLFDSTLETLLSEMMITTTQKKDGEGLQPTSQNTNPAANLPGSEQKVPEAGATVVPVNTNPATAQNAAQTAGASTGAHWADTLLDKLKSNATDLDLKTIPELSGLSPEQRALLARHLLG